MPAPGVIEQNGAGSPFSTNHIIERTQSQWIFASSDLQKAPSIVEGLPASQELANRQKGVNFITQVGIMLKLPQLTLSTASVFLHRYYMRFPMQIPNGRGTHHYQIAATALFLATKVEENCRKMKELIVACCRVAQKNPNAAVDEQSKEYWKWRDTILHHEDMLLEALCFDLQLEQPYRILFDFLCYYGVQDRKALRNTSWAFLNDSHLTTMCLLFPPKTIAGSALYAGLRLAEVSLPDDDQGRPWWEHLGLEIFDIQKACTQMADVYENLNQPGQVPKEGYLKADEVMSFDRTRRTQSPSVEPSPAHSMASQGTKRERESSWGHEGKNGQSMERLASQQSNLDTSLRSPKKAKTETAPVESAGEVRTSRLPPTVGSRIPAAVQGQSDDVQQRIDDIVNASSGRLNASTLPSTNESSDRRREEGRANRNGTHDRQMPRAGPHSPGPPVTNLNPSFEIAGLNSTSRNAGPGELAEEVDYGSEEGEV